MITIVTPVYNTGEYLRPCIDSILAQDYADWQLVLVDDGSSDGSGEICDEYAARDPRVEVLHVPNGGASCARNIGIEAARGEWVTFIDSDDLVTPAYLSDMIEAATPQCDMVISGWEKDGKAVRPRPCVAEKGTYTTSLHGGNLGYILSKLYRTSMLRDNGVKFDAGVCWAEDSIFFWRVLLFCRRIIVIDSVNYTYVTHGDSSINRLHPYDVELKGFEATKELVPRLRAEFPGHVSFSPYAFLVRAITSLYASGLPRSERLARMRKIEFDPDLMFTYGRGLRERVFFRLVRGKHWRLLDYLLTR